MSKLIPTCANILAPFASLFRSQPNVELNSGAVNLRLREKEGVTSPAAAENNLEVITITSLLAAHGPTKLIGLNFEKSAIKRKVSKYVKEYSGDGDT